MDTKCVRGVCGEERGMFVSERIWWCTTMKTWGRDRARVWVWLLLWVNRRGEAYILKREKARERCHCRMYIWTSSLEQHPNRQKQSSEHDTFVTTEIRTKSILGNVLGLIDYTVRGNPREIEMNTWHVASQRAWEHTVDATEQRESRTKKSMTWSCQKTFPTVRNVKQSP